MSYEFWRLLWQQGRWGAIDLKLLHQLVQGWFAGRPVYSELRTAIYPPATYALLWPFLGWLDVTPARWLWALMTVAALCWLVYLVVEESGAGTPLERTFMALIPCSMYATGAAIGNGQLIVHVLPMLVVALVVLYRRPRVWRADLLASALFLATLVKPSISVPFFWLVLFAPDSLRPASVVALGYCALTLFAVSFQDSSFTALFHEWHARSSIVVIGGHGNVANVYIWLASLGLEEWIFPASLVILLALGLWSYHYRHIDVWILLGVTAYVARFWTYHRWYDDALILLPLVALFRIAKQGSTDFGGDVIAGVLLGITLLTMLAPGGLFLFPPPWDTWYVAGQVTIWFAGLIFLLGWGWHTKATSEAKQLSATASGNRSDNFSSGSWRAIK